MRISYINVSYFYAFNISREQFLTETKNWTLAFKTSVQSTTTSRFKCQKRLKSLFKNEKTSKLTETKHKKNFKRTEIQRYLPTWLLSWKRFTWGTTLLMKATVLAESSNLLSFFIVICALQRCLRIVAR